MDQPPLTPLGHGPPSAEHAELLGVFTDRTRRGATRMGNVCHLLAARPQLVASLRGAEDPFERLAGALIEIGCALRSGEVAPPGGWGPGEANAVAGLFAELWSERDAQGAAFAAHHALLVTRAALEDLEVLEEVISAAGLAVPERDRAWPNAAVIERLDVTLRAQLPDTTISNLEGRLAVLSGWVSLGGGNRLLTRLLRGTGAQRSIAVICYALFSEPAGRSSDDTRRASRDVLRLLSSGDLAAALAAAHSLTGLPIS